MIYQNAVAVPRDELSDYAMEGATTATDFVALQALGAFPLTQLQGHYPKITIADGDLLRATASSRMPGQAFDRRKMAFDDGFINLTQVAEEVQIPDEINLQYEDYMPVESIAAVESRNRLMRSIEIAGSIAVQDTVNFSNGNGAAAYTAANIAAGTVLPITDIINAITKVRANGESPDTVIMSEVLWNRIRLAQQVIAYIAGSVNPGAIVTQNTLQAALSNEGIKRVLIGRAYVNLSAANANDNIQPVWSPASIFVGATGTGQLASGGVGRIGYWDKEGPMFNIQTYRDEIKKSNIVRGISTFQAFIANYRAGYLINTQYA